MKNKIISIITIILLVLPIYSVKSLMINNDILKESNFNYNNQHKH